MRVEARIDIDQRTMTSNFQVNILIPVEDAMGDKELLALLIGIEVVNAIKKLTAE
jgi:hypothetical protein